MLAPVKMIMETDVLQSNGEIQKLEMTISQDSSETVYYFLTTCRKEETKGVLLTFQCIVKKQCKPINRV